MKFKLRLKFRMCAMLALSVVACTANARDIKLSELLARPQDFNGKHVAITGYYLAGPETSCLFTSQEAAKKFDTSKSVWVEFRDVPKLDAIAGHNARLVGTFHYDPTVRVKGLRAYGNLWPAALLNVTEFRLLK